MLLKEIYNEQFLQCLAFEIAKVDPDFDTKKFLKVELKKHELKQRMRSITLALNGTLSPKEYRHKIAILKQVAPIMAKEKNSGLSLIILPDFVELFGLDDFDFSMQALEFFTEFGTAEFAVRQFIKLDQKRALNFLQKWSKSNNHHIRRLASEGCRPRLPWGEALIDFKKNPKAILPILENLKCDESEYVRRSVANNLNDISKDHPEILLQLLEKWQGKVSESLIKHALRGLLKKGNQHALKLIGIERNILSENFAIQSFALQKDVVKISQDLSFNFVLENQAQNNKIRLEYAVYFLKKNGTSTKKIFQITTKNFAKGVVSFSKKHSFRDLSTRKHNAGRHFISLVVNGLEMEKKEFILS